jgi:hypothetical protein
MKIKVSSICKYARPLFSHIFSRVHLSLRENRYSIKDIKFYDVFTIHITHNVFYVAQMASELEIPYPSGMGGVPQRSKEKLR